MPTTSALTKRVLRDFKGTWTIRRDIHHDAGPSAQFEGRGVWTPAAGGLDYVEKGMISMPGKALMHAEQTYHWTPDLKVHFSDGRFFHRVPAQGGCAQHWCDPDLYKVTYTFRDWPCFVVTWRVEGPRKSYTMVSRFTRPEVP